MFSVFDLIQLLHGNRRVLTSVLSLWMDESSDQKKEKVVTVAGFLGAGPHILETETKWQAVLDEEQLPYFRASDCAGVDGPFRKYREDPSHVTDSDFQRAFAVRNKLIDCISVGELYGVAVSVIIEDYQRVFATHSLAYRYFDKDPVFAALQILMIESARRMAEQLPNQMMAFVYDENSELRSRLDEVYIALKERNPETAKCMGSLSHMDDKNTPLLQAGDLMASEGRRETELWLRGEGKHTRVFEMLRQQGNLWFIGALNAEYMERIIRENIDDDAAKAYALVG